jgi:hypothetical protein
VELFHANDERDESEWDHPEDIGTFPRRWGTNENILGNMMRCQGCDNEADCRHHVGEQERLDPLRNIPVKFRRQAGN